MVQSSVFRMSLCRLNVLSTRTALSHISSLFCIDEQK